MRELPTPIKTIRLKCLDCCCGDYTEVRECHLVDCPNWPYRMGKRPDDETRDIYLEHHR